MTSVIIGGRKRKNSPDNDTEIDTDNNDMSKVNKNDQKKHKQLEVVFSSTIEMPAPLRDRIAELGGYDIQIVIQKRLQDTDLNRNHGRLSIPIKKLLNDFTTEEEKQLLDQQDEHQNNKNGVSALILDPCLRESTIHLKKWKIGSREIYCLVSQWNSLAQKNSLESGDFIQLWSFRKNSGTPTPHLCFALVKLDISEGIFRFI